MANTPLAILDLVPISSGSAAADALQASISPATPNSSATPATGSPNHLNPGVASTAPTVLLALTASATSAIRIGSGAVQLGHRTPLSVVEEFGLIDALYPGASTSASAARPAARRPGRPVAGTRRRGRGGERPRPERAEDPCQVLRRAAARLATLQTAALRQPGARPAAGLCGAGRRGIAWLTVAPRGRQADREAAPRQRQAHGHP